MSGAAAGMAIEPNRKAVTIYGLRHARTALRVAAALQVPVLLLSAPGAAASAGPAWFLAVVAQAREAHPEADAEAALDCAHFGGHALAALREGLTIIVHDGTANDAVEDIARQYGAAVLRARPAALDTRLAETAGDLEVALRDWLQE